MDDFWEHAAQRDPLWAILSDPAKRGRRWDVQAFFETGRREISLLFYQLRQLGSSPRAGRALDFGCGVGRLTQALAPKFSRVIGVDVSPTMIDLANKLNRHPERAEYVLNHSDNLDRFASGTFDFVYSDIVLQHLSPEAAERFIMEFLRVLSSGGIAVFQLPSHKRTGLEQPPLPTRMPPEAYRARVSIVEGLPKALMVDGSATVVVDLENLSATAWDQTLTGSIRLGNHWRGLNGEMLVQDDGRAVLPGIVKPGQVVRAALAVQAPPYGGTFLCEFDLVHEGISWFCDMGSRTAGAQVVVPAMTRGAAAEQQEPAMGAESNLQELEYPDIYAVLRPDAETPIGEFPMHGILRETVVALVQTHGGTIVLEEDDERGGPEWRGFRYFVSKGQMAGGER